MKDFELGMSIYHRKMKNWKLTISDKSFNDLLKKYDCESAVEFYNKIANEQINLVEMKAIIISLNEAES